MTAIEFTSIARKNKTAYNVIPASSEPSEELVETLELFWNDGALITNSHGQANTYAILVHSRTPFESDRVFRVRIVEVGQS